MRTIFRYEVPVDGKPHNCDLGGPVRAVGSRTNHVVEFWAETDTEAATHPRRFVVTGTGWEVPARAVHRGTTLDGATPSLVWHLWEVCAHDSDAPLSIASTCPVCGYSA